MITWRESWSGIHSDEGNTSLYTVKLVIRKSIKDTLDKENIRVVVSWFHTVVMLLSIKEEATNCWLFGAVTLIRVLRPFNKSINLELVWILISLPSF